MSRKRLSVIIPSRVRESQSIFLARSINSVRVQNACKSHEVCIIVAVDTGCSEHVKSILPETEIDISVIESQGYSQAASLNAAIVRVDSDYVSFLEDDDEWHPDFLNFALQIISRGVGFVSSTQLEINESGDIVRINDFPTPSGWCMHKNTLENVGVFSERHRWHLDHDWLGRLGEKAIDRAHMIECTAPIDPKVITPIRPWLANVIAYGGTRSRLARHIHPIPLVRRHVHSNSGMAGIREDPVKREQSINEKKELAARYGRLPW